MYALMKVAFEMDRMDLPKEDINRYIEYYFSQNGENTERAVSDITGDFFGVSNTEQQKEVSAINSQVLELDESADELLEGIINRHKMRSGLNVSSGLPTVSAPKTTGIHNVFGGWTNN